MTDPGHDPLIGRTIDACTLTRRLGIGAHSVVYEAQHSTTGERTALKILSPALTGGPSTVERFFREAQALASLNHPGAVAVRNVGQEGDYYFIRMELVDGRLLSDRVDLDGPLPWQAAAGVGAEVADCLDHLHQKGMVHRDVGPHHMMFTGDGRIHLIGFALTKHVHSAASVSVTGQPVGTPAWVSPEQAGAKPTDARADIYSLGVTLYYLTTGVRPFNGKNMQEILLKHFFYMPESPVIYNESLPEELCAVIIRCMQKKKLERYQSAAELARDLRAVPGL